MAIESKNRGRCERKGDSNGFRGVNGAINSQVE